MDHHADILDQQDSLRGPLFQSVLLHAAVAGAFIVASINYQHSREVWGSAQTAAGSAVAVTAVKTIPLPSRAGHINPVANDTESLVPQAPKPEPKRQVRQIDEKAIPLSRHRMIKPQPRQQALQRYHPEPPPPNQVFSHEAPAAVSPMFQKVGSGGVGVAPNSTFGTQFGGYASLVIQRVTDKWQTNGLAGLHVPMAVVTFDIQRDGSIRNPQVAQGSGNSTLDFSALRAVSDAAPFPPLPPQFSGSSTHVELQFQLQR
ncbi:MAG TPA: TonB family protein [Bryobacteraceae bacterium]|nr:TonB family protein [Bryobacteraceae bacterium]